MKKSFYLVAFIVMASWSSFAQEPAFTITHGPYLQALTESEVTIVWTTNRKAISWVELAPDDDTHYYQTERPRSYAESYGFKSVDSVHAVTLSGLNPNTTYRYRIYSQEVLSHVGTKVLYGDIAASNVYRQKPLKFTTSNPSNSEVSFLVLNDIHGNNDLMETLLENTDWEQTDMVFFNGDMTNDIRSEQQLFGDFLDKAVELFAGETPMYYARGNHETRGNFATTFPRYFPTPTNQLYYMFRQGPVCFVVLDSGEDKPDSDLEYSGIVAFDNYRTQQAEWLKKAVKQDVFRDASYRVVIVHMPPFGGWHGEEEVARKFVPVLNDAGIDVMLCGHLHRHVHKKAGEGQKFPVIANSNKAIIKAQTKNATLNINIFGADGKLVDSLQIQSRK
ncbi:Purple acid Phosphatase, N-terminal domain [Saccharicrinis carchari]|uniref:Purple acid Phosphatase, N-terminal domain n=1 Tax=Saccharicrinis carchari TaxID=1168039 RepID=A0A521BXQ9_SACCC|nr:FN3 domain-containing metallophosphoesterase family protein [Saccharicrinis carchari]SMO51825.1 Purple acid Phosphatase, N-terminal domain [Saccharicrinis carchari]